MEFEIIHLPEQPVVLFTSSGGFNLLAALPIMLDEVHRVLNTLDDSIFYLIDIRGTHIPVADAMKSMGPIIFGEKAFFNHPKIREVLLITPSHLLRKITEGVANGLQHDLTLLVFDDLDSAFSYIDQRLDEAPLLPNSH